MHWSIPLAALVLAGAGTTWYLLKVRLPRDESVAGVAALSAMSWREFINVVLAALTRRGYDRVFEQDAARDDSEYILAREGGRWLLSCKHGSAFVLGPSAVTEMVNAIRLNGLQGGLLLTQGRIAEDARPVAKLQRVELLDGPTLWPELCDLIPAQQRAVIAQDARQRARKQVVLVWLGVVLACLLAAIALRPDQPPAMPAPVAADVGAEPAPRAPARDLPVVERPAVRAPEPPAASAAAPVVLGVEQQRAAVASAVATLPMVDRALWLTQSTLEVQLLRVVGDIKPELCPMLERYPALAASRVQLTPPPGSGASVRFLQCRAY